MADDEQQRIKRPRKSEREMANRVRAAEIISKGALRLFDIDGRSVEVHVLNAQRTGMLYLVYEGKPYVGGFYSDSTELHTGWKLHGTREHRHC